MKWVGVRLAKLKYEKKKKTKHYIERLRRKSQSDERRKQERLDNPDKIREKEKK